MPIKLAFGYKMRVGKDTAVDYLISKIGGEKLSFATPIYEIVSFAQKTANLPIYKDRQLLQYIGTEWGRGLDPNIWVNILIDKSNKIADKNLFISDLRFKNEFTILQQNGWTCVRIDNTNPTEISNHASEVDLDTLEDNKWDYIIKNTASLDLFYTNLDNMIDIIR